MARRSFKAGAVTAPVPPAMVTVGEGDEVNVLTVAWTGILATVPPKTYISVRPERHSHGLLVKTGEFVINLAPSSLAHTVDFVGMYTGAKVDKFQKCSLTKLDSEQVGAPTIAECPIAIECRVCEVLHMGSHDVFIADILGFTCDESIIDESGRICFERADLVAYMHGEYFKLGEKLGKFGFGTGREGKKVAAKNAPKRAQTAIKKTKAEASATGAAEIKRAQAAEDQKALSADGTKKKARKNPEGEQPFYKNLPRQVLKRSARRKKG